MKRVYKHIYFNYIFRFAFFSIIIFNYFLLYSLKILDKTNQILLFFQVGLNLSFLYFLIKIEFLTLKINHFEGKSIFEKIELTDVQIQYKIRRFYSEPKIFYLFLFTFANLFIFQFFIITDYGALLFFYNIFNLIYFLSHYYDYILKLVIDNIFYKDYQLIKIIDNCINIEEMKSTKGKFNSAIFLLIFDVLVFIKLLSMKGWI